MGGFFDAQEAPELTTPAPTPNMAPAHSPSAAAASAAPAQPEPPVAQPPAAPSAEGAPDNRPPWEQNGEKFDPKKAWDLIQNLRNYRDDLLQFKADAEPVIAEREQLRRASMEDNERLNEDLGKANTAAETWRTQAIRAKAEALAAGRFVDTETALALIGDVSAFATPDGIDTAALTARLDQLAVDKPFLVAAPPQPPGFTPNRAQGQSGTGGAISLDAQIVAAEKAGDHRRAIALKHQKKYSQT